MSPLDSDRQGATVDRTGLAADTYTLAFHVRRPTACDAATLVATGHTQYNVGLGLELLMETPRLKLAIDTAPGELLPTST